MDNKSKTVYSLIDRFVTSEGGVTLVLPITSNSGQSLAQNGQEVFIWALLVQRGHNLAFYSM